MELRQNEQKIMDVMDLNPITTYSLAALLNTSASSVYQALKVMEAKGVVKQIRQSKRVLWVKYERTSV